MNDTMEIECDTRRNGSYGQLYGEVAGEEWSFEVAATSNGYPGRMHLGIRSDERMVYSNVVNPSDILESSVEDRQNVQRLFEYALNRFDDWQSLIADTEKSIAYIGPRDPDELGR